VLKKIKIKK